MVPDPTPQGQREIGVRATEAQKLLKKGTRNQRENARLNRLDPTSAQTAAADTKTDESGNFLRADGKPVKPLGKGDIDFVVKQQEEN